MKNWFKKLNSDNKVLFTTGTFSLVVFLVMIPFAILFNWYFLLIGWGSGSVVSLINLVLTFKGSTLLTLEKPKTGIYILFYALRMILFIGLFILFAVLQWVVKVEITYWAILPCAITILPSHVMLMIFHKGK